MRDSIAHIGRLAPELALLGIAAVTRLPLLLSAQGEPDSARFVLAVWQWMRFGAHPRPDIFTYHYYPVLAPGYFLLAGALASFAQVSAAHLGFFLTGLSALAALATAPLLYRVGRRILPRGVAWMAALLFLLSPAFWWLGIEAHPQGLALLAYLLSLDFLLQDRWAWAGLALTGALLLRCDTLLLIPALAAAYSLTGSKKISDWFRMGASFTLACVGFTVARWMILGTAADEESAAVVQRFWQHSSLLHQVLPLITAPGVAVCVLALVGIIRMARTRHALLAWATLPGLGFWMCITGNNVRHVAGFWLPLLWAGCFGIWKWRAKLLVPAGVVCLALNCLVIPPNSNTTVYPAANVFASHHMLAEKEAMVRKAALRLWKSAELYQSACFLGAAANPYFLDALLLQPDSPRILSINPQWQRIIFPEGTILVGDAYNDREYLSARAVCPNGLSFEYAAPDRHLWFWGSELDRSQWMRQTERWAHGLDMRHAQDTLQLPPLARRNAESRP